MIFTADESPDALAASGPRLDGIDPRQVTPTDKDLTVTLTGRSFASDARVEVAGQRLEVTARDGRKLVAVVPASMLTQPGSLELVVVNPGPPPVTSQSRKLVVNEPSP